MRLRLLIALLFFLLGLSGQSPAQIRQDASVLSSAGGMATSGPYDLVAMAVGQPSPSQRAEAGRYALISGYVATLFDLTDNRAPELIGSLLDQTLTVDGEPFTLDLNEIFNDPDGDVLTFSANSSDTTIATVDIATNLLTVRPIAVGSASITLMARDGKGGLRVASFTATVISNQIAEPSATQAPRVGEALTLQVVPPPGFQPTTRQLFYRSGGETAYQVADLIAAGSEFAGTIPAGSVTIRGVEYYVFLSNGQTAVTFPATNPEQNPVILRVQVGDIGFQAALARLEYKMVSVPLALVDPEIDAVLLDDYGPYDVLPRQWRLFRFENDAYAEHENIAARFTPGNAFWLITRGGQAFDVENAQSVNSAQPFEITLQPGWNQIATPFAFAIDWADISASGNVQPPVFFDGVEYQFGIATLEPWEGYFVFNVETSPVTLSVPALESGVSSLAKADLFEDVGFLVQLAAHVSEKSLRDTQNFVGFAESANEGLDELDYLEPPNLAPYLRLTSVHNGQEFASNFKPIDNAGQEWQLQLASTLPEQVVQISLMERGNRPDGFELYLLDVDNGQRLFAEDGAFSVTMTETQTPRTLRLIVGTPEFAEQNNAGIPLLPVEFALFQNYPNPFNPETTIRYQIKEPGPVRLEIFNLLGQKIRTLMDEQHLAGSFSVVWNGRDDFGKTAASGVYVYRLSSGSQTFTRKLVWIR